MYTCKCRPKVDGKQMVKRHPEDGKTGYGLRMGEMTLEWGGWFQRVSSGGLLGVHRKIQALAHLKAVDEGHMKGIGPVDDAVDEEGSHGEPPEPGW